MKVFLDKVFENSNKKKIKYYDKSSKIIQTDFIKLNKNYKLILQFLQNNFNEDTNVAIISENNFNLIQLIIPCIIFFRKTVIIPSDETKFIRDDIIKKLSVGLVLFSSKKDYENFNSTFIKKKILLDNILKRNSKIKIPINFKKKSIYNNSIIYCSSGTTGKSKIIELNYKIITTQIKQIKDRLRIDKQNTLFTPMPLTHISGFFFVFLNSFLFNKNLILTNFFNILIFKKLLLNKNLTFIYLNPSMVNLISKSSLHFNSKSKKKLTLICGSAPLSKYVLGNFLKKLDCNFIHLMGMTETCNTAYSSPSIGVPLNGVNVKIFKKGYVKKEGVEGELLLSGNNIIQKYFYPKTKSLFHKNYIRTGDICFFRIINGRKYYFISGRIKEMLIRNGINVYLNEIDDFYQKNGISSVFSVSINDVYLGEDLILVTQKKYSENFKSKIIKISAKLSKYMRPTRIFFLKDIFRTKSGKIKRNQIGFYVATHKDKLRFDYL